MLAWIPTSTSDLIASANKWRKFEPSSFSRNHYMMEKKKKTSRKVYMQAISVFLVVVVSELRSHIQLNSNKRIFLYGEAFFFFFLFVLRSMKQWGRKLGQSPKKPTRSRRGRKKENGEREGVKRRRTKMTSRPKKARVIVSFFLLEGNGLLVKKAKHGSSTERR